MGFFRVGGGGNVSKFFLLFLCCVVGEGESFSFLTVEGKKLFYLRPQQNVVNMKNILGNYFYFLIS